MAYVVCGAPSDERREFPVTRVHPIVLVDGRSGSGKTQFATQLATELGGSLLSLDEVYPGWDGLDAGSWHVYQHVLHALASNTPGRYRVWDWRTQKPAHWVSVPAGTPLVIEGCGAIRRESVARATKAIWLEAPETIRYERAVSREGEYYKPLWKRWALQEDRFIALHRPRELATTEHYTG